VSPARWSRSSCSSCRCSGNAWLLGGAALQCHPLRTQPPCTSTCSAPSATARAQIRQQRESDREHALRHAFENTASMYIHMFCTISHCTYTDRQQRVSVRERALCHASENTASMYIHTFCTISYCTYTDKTTKGVCQTRSVRCVMLLDAAPPEATASVHTHAFRTDSYCTCNHLRAPFHINTKTTPFFRAQLKLASPLNHTRSDQPHSSSSLYLCPAQFDTQWLSRGFLVYDATTCLLNDFAHCPAQFDTQWLSCL